MITGHGTTDEGTREGVSRTLNQHLVWCTGIVKALIGQDQIIGHVIPYQDTTLFDVILREAAKQLNRLFILNNGATALTDNLHIHTTLIQIHKLVIVEIGSLTLFGELILTDHLDIMSRDVFINRLALRVFQIRISLTFITTGEEQDTAEQCQQSVRFLHFFAFCINFGRKYTNKLPIIRNIRLL